MTNTELQQQGKVTITPPNGASRNLKQQSAAIKRSLLAFLVVMGPGLIVMEADNDAGAVSTYTQAGAQYGTHLLWLMVILLPICYFMQEMSARVGIATGEGFASLIYKRFGKGWGSFSLIALQLTNFFTLVTEFAAIDLVATKLGLPPVFVVPLVAVALILVVLTGTYRSWERAVVLLCLLDAVWFAMAYFVHPNWGEAAVHSVVPTVPSSGLNLPYVFLVVAVIGTTIAPWQLFFQQSCVCDKGLGEGDLRFARLDTFIGAVFTVLVAGAMMLVGDAIFRAHGAYADPAQLAFDLLPIHGEFVKNFILIMFVNAAVLGTTAVSLSSSWSYAEVKGWPHSLQQPFRNAKGFYVLYIVGVMSAALLVLIPRAPLQFIILAVQVLAAIMLPSTIIFLQLLSNDKKLLGEKFVNRNWNNVINWIVVVVLFCLSVLLAAQVALPGLFPSP